VFTFLRNKRSPSPEYALVDVERIARIVSNGDGPATLTLSDGSTVRVSRRRAAEVRTRLAG
jgi:DNA-binding LytR/AlgR family response regulator